MAISKAMQATLRALSYSETDIKKNYKMHRQIKNLTSKRIIKPKLYEVWDRTIPCGDHQIPIRIFKPDQDALPSVLLFFHGGGWVVGNIDSYDGVCADMARLTNRIVISVDYRLAPEHRFPAAPEDCYAAAKMIFMYSSLFNTSPEEITLIGDSAGGNLAAAVSQMARDRGEFLPSRQILIYPATGNDHSPDSPFRSIVENGTDYLLTSKRVREYMELYMSSPSDLQNPYFAPLMAKDFSHQPDTLIISAEYCPLRDEGEAYGRRLEEAGNRVEVHRMTDGLHGYFSLPALFSQVKETYEIINDFLEVNSSMEQYNERRQER